MLMTNKCWNRSWQYLWFTDKLHSTYSNWTNQYLQCAHAMLLKMHSTPPKCFNSLCRV